MGLSLNMPVYLENPAKIVAIIIVMISPVLAYMIPNDFS
jgi:hypothetical protein